MLISTSVQNIIALVHRGSYRQDKLTLHQASPLEDVPWLRLGICLLGAGKGKKQTKFPIEVRTLKQEREIDDDYATMRESFSLVQKILFGAFGATSFLRWSCFPGDSNMCCFGRRSDCNTLGIIHREEHGFWEHCKIYTCWKFENHSFPLCLVTHKQHIIYTNLENSSGEKWLMKRMGSPPCYNAKASKCHDVTIFSWPTITSHIIMTSVFHCFTNRWSYYISMAVSIFERRQNMATLERTVFQIFCRENN